MRTVFPILATLCWAVIIAPAALLRAADPELDKPLAKNGCSIAFPKLWRTESRAGASAFVFAFSPTPDSRDGVDYAAQFNVSRAPLPKDDLLTIAKSFQTAMTKDPKSTNYKPLDTPREITINTAKAVTFGGSFTQGGKPLRNRQWLITAPGRLYIVTFTTLQSSWDTRAVTGEASVSTFKVLDEKP